jgi:molybdopterin-guanine dinucleotide biosynthesis adapter protein
MALVKPVIFQVAGYQNSGKTTFLSKVISDLSAEKWKVVTLKHHGHGGQPDLLNSKDSSKHIDAGAIASLVEGEGRMVLHAEQPSWELTEQIQLVSFFNPDFILIEGHKREDFPKMVLIRDEDDLQLLNELTNIKVIFYWQETLINEKIPCFHINDRQGYSWLINHLTNEHQQ